LLNLFLSAVSAKQDTRHSRPEGKKIKIIIRADQLLSCHLSSQTTPQLIDVLAES
jgi:hypothetical protein